MKEITDEKLDLINDITLYHPEVFQEADFDSYPRSLVNNVVAQTYVWNIKELFYMSTKELTELKTKLERY